MSALAVASLVAGVLTATSAAAATSETDPTPEPRITASTGPNTIPTPLATPSATPEPIPTATPEPSATPTPTATPGEISDEEMDRIAQDTTLDAAVVEEGALGRASAASLVGFDAGNIVSDAVFYNGTAMSSTQIQAFLKSKVPTCRSGYTCLKDFTTTTTTRAADAYCAKPYQGAKNETAARIIAKVAQACGINPQVLLVMLQKEQGLVTHTWPSSWRYTIAMGMACPDTSACDTRYYGFQNQVYGAARQYQIYAKSSYFNWFPVGKSSQVQYHPNASCGSGAVTMKNKATASLYYYTPYQPNAAALRAGYGEGDACSAYGNRNFYNYFTDWFGSTRTPEPALIRAGTDIFLLNGTTKVHITQATIGEYQAAFGGWTQVSAQYAAQFPTKGKATLFLRNASTGDVSLLQGGTRHYFSTCAQVAQWGGRCGTETALTSATYAAVPAGERLTNFVRKRAGGALYLIDGSRLDPLYNRAAATTLNGGKWPYAAVMPAAGLKRHGSGEVRFAPGTFLEQNGSVRAYLPTSDRRLVYLPSWGIADEYGLARGASARVPASTLALYKKTGTLGLFARCGGTPYIAAGGTLRPITSSYGFHVSNLDAATCAQLDRSNASRLGALYVQGKGRDEVYLLQGGKLRHVTTPAVLNRLGGGKRPLVLSLSAQTVDFLPKGAAVR
ncbi:procyclic acidic repetitive family protein [Microbacterium betulae]|uniref:Procyclic acidic repetitive family protein n=1 Tax=Microbacterium betulae TaxID=2981139 RepID=A0AA97I6S9_9MICO|nr:hypothetical protein [Microbacterium sp. AB]WOF24164.1 procyclic acidic repetitive family protein [Microbacterium sp. AB]